MAEVPITSEDITDLAETLDSLDLPAGQKALLSGIIAAASSALAGSEPSVSVDVEGTLPSFQQQFAAAFTPGEVADVDSGPGGAKSLTVTHKAKIGRD